MSFVFLPALQPVETEACHEDDADLQCSFCFADGGERQRKAKSLSDFINGGYIYCVVNQDLR